MRTGLRVARKNNRKKYMGYKESAVILFVQGRVSNPPFLFLRDNVNNAALSSSVSSVLRLDTG